MKKLTFVLLAMLLLGSVVFACGSSKAKDGVKEVVIGVFQPLNGENGGGGYQEVLGIRYANVVYPTVQINGETYKVLLVEADNKSDKTEAVTAAQRLIFSGASVIIG